MIGERIKELRKSMNLTQNELASKIGLNQNTYAHYEYNTREPSVDVLVKIAEEFNINSDWLLTGRGTMYHNGKGAIERPDGRVQMIEVLNAKACAGPGFENYDISVVDMVPVPTRIIEPYPPDRVKAVCVQGDSMTPLIYDGDFVLYVPGEIRENGIYIIDVFGNLRCKRLEFKLSGDITVMSDNARYSSEVFKGGDETLRICGKVIGWMHKHNY